MKSKRALRKAAKRTGCPVVLIQWVDCAGPDGNSQGWRGRGVLMPEKTVRVLHRRASDGSFSSDEGDQIELIVRSVRHPRRLKKVKPESIAETRRQVLEELRRAD